MKINMKHIVAVLLVIVGIVSLCMAGGLNDVSTGGYEAAVSYGGDAYTGIQNAAAQTANNVRWVTEAVAQVGSSILVVAGLALIVAGVATWPLDENGKPVLPVFTAASAVVPAPQAEPVETMFCPVCGSSQAKDAGFCGSCGTKLN